MMYCMAPPDVKLRLCARVSQDLVGLITLTAAVQARVDRLTEMGKERGEPGDIGLVTASEEGKRAVAAPTLPLEKGKLTTWYLARRPATSTSHKGERGAKSGVNRALSQPNLLPPLPRRNIRRRIGHQRKRP